MSASAFAGSPRCAFTLTRNVAGPAVDLFQNFSIASRKNVFLLTSLNRRHLPIFSQPSTALDCRTNKTWALSRGCNVTPRHRLLVRFELDPSSSHPGFPLDSCQSYMIFILFCPTPLLLSTTPEFFLASQWDLCELSRIIPQCHFDIVLLPP